MPEYENGLLKTLSYGTTGDGGYAPVSVSGGSAASGSFSVHTGSTVPNNSWGAAVPLSLPTDRMRISALGVSLGAISGLTDFDWYLSWDNSGLIPITDKVSWNLASNMKKSRDDASYIAVGTIDLFVSRPSGVGITNTAYLHVSGSGGTADGTWILYGTE